MDFFSCTEEELAKILAENGEMYAAGARFLEGLKNKGVLSKSLDDSVDEALRTLKSANNIATPRAHTIFLRFMTAGLKNREAMG